MCGPESQAQKLSRQGMTHTHLLNLTLPWCLPFFLAIGFFQPPLLLSRAVTGRTGAPVTYRPPTPPVSLAQVQGIWWLLVPPPGIPAGGREPGQLSRAR